MLLLAAVLASAAPAEELVLREKACVPGRFVRLVDLLDPARGSEAARGRLADVWLGRAPEEGRTRRIDADEIRRELERRGFEPGAFDVVGRDVEVERGAGDGAVRRAVAFEIKRALLEKDGVRADELAVRVARLVPEPAAEADVQGVREDGDAWVVSFAGGGEARAEARILRVRETAFAAVEIPAGRTLERGDLDWRRVETDAAEAAPEDVVGAVAALRIRKGAPITPADLKLKPLVRRGEVVRVASAAFDVDGRALEDGALGREIEVEIAASKARLRGRVAGAGRVEVRR